MRNGGPAPRYGAGQTVHIDPGLARDSVPMGLISPAGLGKIAGGALLGVVVPSMRGKQTRHRKVLQVVTSRGCPDPL